MYIMHVHLNSINWTNTLIEIDGPRSDETYYPHIDEWKTMFQADDFKREEIEKSLKWNSKNEKESESEKWTASCTVR